MRARDEAGGVLMQQHAALGGHTDGASGGVVVLGVGAHAGQRVDAQLRELVGRAAWDDARL